MVGSNLVYSAGNKWYTLQKKNDEFVEGDWQCFELGQDSFPVRINGCTYKLFFMLLMVIYKTLYSL